jgi:hypothetical protein
MQVNALKNKLTNKLETIFIGCINGVGKWKSVSQRWSLTTFLNPAVVITRFNERCMCDTQDLAQ